MIKWANRLIAVCLLLCFSSLSVSANALESKEIKREANSYKLDIKYPQGFDDPYLDTAIRSQIEVIKQKFIAGLSDQADLPSGISGKNSLVIRYEILYRLQSVVSIKLMVSSYSRGAAHPNNSINILNFIRGEQVKMADLFKAKSAFLKPIVSYCRKKLLANNHFDKKWVLEGTSPSSKNYKNWSFSQDGLVIFFDTYQIAPYADGPQKVALPFAEFETFLKPKVSRTVWGK